MQITKRHIPFLISAASFLALIFVNVILIWNFNFNITDIFSDYGRVISLISLMIIAFSLLHKSNVWAYLYLAFLLASFIPSLRITGLINFTLYFFVPINAISLVLLIYHIYLNGDIFQVKEESQEIIDNRAEQKRSIYRSNFKKKSLEELKNIDITELTVEARVVLMDLIDELKAESKDN